MNNRKQIFFFWGEFRYLDNIGTQSPHGHTDKITEKENGKAEKQ